MSSKYKFHDPDKLYFVSFAVVHWIDPTKVNHGKWGSGPFHSGDIGNVELDGAGNGNWVRNYK